jgi:rubrerythrin
MTELFSIRELLQVAIREEETGAAFYRELAEHTDDKDLEAFALRVAEMEDAHKEWFSELLESCRDSGVGREAPGEYLSYLAAERVLTDEDQARQLARDLDDEEAARRAMALERETLLFLLEMKDFVPKDELAVLEEVIDEERQHVTDWVKFRQQHYG